MDFTNFVPQNEAVKDKVYIFFSNEKTPPYKQVPESELLQSGIEFGGKTRMETEQHRHEDGEPIYKYAHYYPYRKKQGDELGLFVYNKTVEQTGLCVYNMKELKAWLADTEQNYRDQQKDREWHLSVSELHSWAAGAINHTMGFEAEPNDKKRLRMIRNTIMLILELESKALAFCPDANGEGEE